MARSARRRRAAAGLGALALVLAGAAAHGQTFVSREEALAAVYPGAEMDAERVFLSRTQVDAVADLSGEDVTGRIYARYLARRGGAVVGRAYVDTHIVRTKRESLLISLDADGRLRRIDVTAFLEPREYVPPDAWLQQYYGRPLDDDLAPQRAIRTIAGATLTVRAVNAAARRVLALDQVLRAGE